MTIHFYLDDFDETPITSLYNMTSNPFAVGDVIKLDVGDFHPVDYNKFKIDVQQKFINNHAELREKFHLKDVVLKRKVKFIEINFLRESEVTIEYYCTFNQV